MMLAPQRLMGGDVAIEPPRHPHEEDASGQHQAQNVEDAGGDQGQADAQHHRQRHAPEHHLVAAAAGQPSGRRADHHGVVAGEHEIDQDDLKEGGEG